MSLSLRMRVRSAAKPSGSGRAIACRALLLVTVMLPVTSMAQDKDDLWEVTTKVEVPGMPMAMPPQTIRQCVAKDGKDEAYIPRQQNCRLVDHQRTGNRITFKMECAGADAMEVTGEVMVGTESYDGRMRMAMRKEGQSMELTSTFAGKRVGACTATAK